MHRVRERATYSLDVTFWEDSFKYTPHNPLVKNFFFIFPVIFGSEGVLSSEIKGCIVLAVGLCVCTYMYPYLDSKATHTVVIGGLQPMIYLPRDRGEQTALLCFS